jgi:hypothetical protein
MQDRGQQDLFDLKHAIVMEEWKLANSNVGRLDGIIFTIRGWAITTTTAAIAYAYTKPDPTVCMLILVPLVALWIMDALFKAFQRVFINRSKEIEVYLASTEFEEDYRARRMENFTTPDLAVRFGQKGLGLRLKVVFEQAFLRNVLLTYFPLAIFSMISYTVIQMR